MLSVIFSILSAIVNIYTILCVIDIILSWIPGSKYSGFGKFISKVCDPYLNLFSKIKFLQLGNIDFSPIISIGILSLLSSILSGITHTGRIYIGGIAGTLVQIIWSALSMILSIILIFAFIRWIVLLTNKPTNSFWNQFDNLFQNFSYKISKPFSKGIISYKQSLLITWIITIILLIFGNIATTVLAKIFYSLPI